MTERDEIQLQAMKAWLNDKRGTVVLPTGAGKTFVGATIAVKQWQLGSIESVLIVVPTTALIDQWRSEIIKFYGEDMLNTKAIDIICIQSAYKIPRYVDLMIVDEVHTALSDKYSNIFTIVQRTQTLGLTATIPARDNQLEILNKYCPVVYSKTLHEVSEQHVVSDYMIYNLEVPMNRRDTARYRIFDSQFKRAQMELGILKYRDPVLHKMDVFSIAKEYYKEKSKEPIVKYSKQYWSSMTMRKWVCYEAESKIQYVINILKKFPEKKWIIFNKSVKFAEKLKETIPYASVIYHHKMKDKDRTQVLQDFEDSKYKILIAVDALNAGLNVPDVDAAICVSGVSTELTSVQQLGRIIRKRPDKVAMFINLYSKGTVEENWVKSKTKTFPNLIWTNNISQIC